jgi:polyhydroxyalkanoate synthesis regulator phasin
MAHSDVLRKYLDAGVAFTEMTRSRAEAIVRDLVRNGEIQRDQAQEWADALVSRSRQNSEAAIRMIRAEVSRQMTNMGLATREDITKLVTRINELTGAPVRKRRARKAGARKKATAKRRPAKRTAAKRTTAKRTTARRTAAKRTTKRRSTAKRATAKRTAAKRTTKRRSTAKRRPAKRTAAKRTTKRRSTARRRRVAAS